MREQYIAQSSNNETITSGQQVCSDANVASEQNLLKDLHGRRSHGNTNIVAKPRNKKNRFYKRPKPIHKLIADTLSLKAPPEKVTDSNSRDVEMGAIEIHLDGVWGDTGQ